MSNKASVIERCLQRINEEYEGDPDHLKNFTKQDSIILNLRRAYEASIGLAMYIVDEEKLGVTQTSREAFTFLESSKMISPSLSKNMKSISVILHGLQSVFLNIDKEDYLLRCK
ncbi:type VII toxin-antitoxin system HepT family RNase toxin [Halobacillus amylolyticus]|uniref:DUF86 domain-containing protein n=1 Tax=Halobacillus amylolyticus TaxID=2932259 RepID=A0ABY4H828_9BACI|nr:HepT-like ribonuclease domain-containing protein [Halobacillus amylolyticus]UOR10759.1 DUF86 domain-containing protein [Halobacillus amylolyticus]